MDVAWHDPQLVTSEIMDGYGKSFRTPHWEQAMWEIVMAREQAHLDERLSTVQVPVLVVSGDDDRLVPLEQSQLLSRQLQQAEMVVISRCGHIPPEERPAQFLAALTDFVRRLA